MKKLILLLLLAGCERSNIALTFDDHDPLENGWHERPCIIVLSEKSSLMTGCGTDETIPENFLRLLSISNARMKGWVK